MSRHQERYQEGDRPPIVAQEPPKLVTKVDRNVFRYTECNVCEEKDPNYIGCNHPEDADESHPDGGPAIGRINHQKSEDLANNSDSSKRPGELTVADLELADLCTIVAYPSYGHWLNDTTCDADVPEVFRICLTSIPEHIVQSCISSFIEKKIMLRVRALEDFLAKNLGDTATSLVLFTSRGLLLGATSHRNTLYGGFDPKKVACLLAITYRSATATLQSGYNILSPTKPSTSNSDPANAQAHLQAESSKYTNTDHIKKAEDPERRIPYLLPLPILRQKNFVADAKAGTKRIRSLLVTCDTDVVAVEYLREGLFVGAMGFKLDKFLLEDDKGKGKAVEGAAENVNARDESTPADAKRVALLEEKEQLLDKLEDWTAKLAEVLRLELKDFRMDI